MPRAEVVTPQLLRGWPLPEAEDGGTKHDRGTVLVVGGAAATPGAVLLTGLAALRVGAGKLQVVTVEQTAVALAVSVPEAAVVGLPALDAAAGEEVARRAERATAVVLGPGLMDKEAAHALVRAVVPRLDGTPVLLDGTALSGMAGDVEVLRGATVVMTPNAGELAALLEGEELEGEDAALRVAERYGAVVSSPGWVATPGGSSWCVQSGGIGLGTSGSGDVLAGLVGGALARGAAPEQAATWGQYVHCAAGDLLTARLGRVGFLARELLDEVPVALGTLRA